MGGWIWFFSSGAPQVPASCCLSRPGLSRGGPPVLPMAEGDRGVTRGTGRDVHDGLEKGHLRIIYKVSEVGDSFEWRLFVD